MTGKRKTEIRVCEVCGVEFLGKAPARLCPMHAIENRKQCNREYKARLKKKGLCLDCRKPVVPGKLFCADCLAKRVEYQKDFMLGKRQGRLEHGHRKQDVG